MRLGAVSDDPRIEVYGTVDELNSVLGVVLCEDLPPALREALGEVQHDLFDLGGELSVPGMSLVGEDHLARLDDLIARFNADLPPLQEFVLPGGSRGAALCHLARTVCRRAERSVVPLVRTGAPAA